MRAVDVVVVVIVVVIIIIVVVVVVVVVVILVIVVVIVVIIVIIVVVEKQNSRLAFGNADAIDSKTDINNLEQECSLSLLGNAIGGGVSPSIASPKLPSNKKIKHGGRSEKVIQKRMMEAAMLMQSQEYM
jgi:hypothetical protein